MSGPLSGQHALVLGASAGIGLATARLLHKDGATVTITGRRESKLAEAAVDIGAGVRTVVADATTAEGVLAAIAVASELGRLDIAVTIPGGGGYSPILAFDESSFMEQIDRNVRPAFLAIRHCGHAMAADGGGGSIVCISSTAGTFSSRYLSAYCAGKAAIDQLVRVAADEVGRYGIRVNAVAPGLTHTEATDGMFARAGVAAQFLELQPLARHGAPEDIAAAIRYFAGPESSWTTGQILVVDGGHTLRMFPDAEPMVRSLLGDNVFDLG